MFSNKDIPVTAFLNFQLLYQIELAIEADSAPSVDEVIDETSERLGASPPLSQYYRPMNTGAVFGLLYATLVVPKELNSADYFHDCPAQSFKVL